MLDTDTKTKLTETVIRTLARLTTPNRKAHITVDTRLVDLGFDHEDIEELVDALEDELDRDFSFLLSLLYVNERTITVAEVVALLEPQPRPRPKKPLQAQTGSFGREPDAFCVTAANGECESLDPRCMHQVFNVPFNPPEEMWDGLARDIMMWLDMQGERPTPRHLFLHLKRSGTPVPKWMEDEAELKNLDGVPSKGTRVVLIYKAMLDAWLQHQAKTKAQAPAQDQDQDQSNGEGSPNG